MNHFFLSCSLAWSREFFALCHPKWEYVCRSVHVYQLRLGEWESENKMCSSYHWQQLHNSKALVHIGHNPNFFPSKLSPNTHFSALSLCKRDAKEEEEEKRQSTARSAQKMDSLCMICGVAFLPLVYLHWYQTNSRWQPSDSLSAIKRNANCQHTQRERERGKTVRIRVIYLDFGCVKLLVVFWSDSPILFAPCLHSDLLNINFILLAFEIVPIFFRCLLLAIKYRWSELANDMTTKSIDDFILHVPFIG